MKYLTTISKREKEVLLLIAHEYTTKEIASHLYISPHTPLIEQLEYRSFEHINPHHRG